MLEIFDLRTFDNALEEGFEIVDKSYLAWL